MKSELCRQYNGRVQRDFPIVDFVRHVWGFQSDDIPEGEYQLTSWNLAAYLRQGYFYKSISEDQKHIVVDGDRLGGRDFRELLLNESLDAIIKNNKSSRNRKVAPLEGLFRYSFLKWKLDNPQHPNPTFYYDLGHSLPCEEVQWHHLGVIGELRKTRRILQDHLDIETETAHVDLSKLKVKKGVFPLR